MQTPQRAEANHLPVALIPKAKMEGFQARKQGHRFDGLEEWFGTLTPFEIVVRDSRAQMMDVVKTDVATEPLQDPRQFVVRTPVERRVSVIPLLCPFPIHALELMLDVKEPDAG